MQPSREATCTAPHEYFSQIAIPSTFWANCAVRILLFDAVPTNSFAFGIFANTSPFALNPLGGHLGFGDGVIVTFLRGFFLTTAFFVAFAVAFGETVGLAVVFGETVGLAVVFGETVGLAVVFVVGVGVAFVVAAFDGKAVIAINIAITMPNVRLIAIPLKFTY